MGYQIDLVIGTRPNIIKAAPLYSALEALPGCRPRMVFLMQHTDPALSWQALDDLGIPREKIVPVHLEGTGYERRFGEMLSSYTTLVSDHPPHLTVVFGDVDTTLAAAYAAKRAQVAVAHVEAGLRSGDKRMPEELNRLMVDAISDLHFATTEEARETLISREGHAPAGVIFVGNLMIDSLLQTADAHTGRAIAQKLGVDPSNFAVATFHRPSNVDTEESLREMLKLLGDASRQIPIVLPLHPRTSASLVKHRLRDELTAIENLVVTDSMRYREFISLLKISRAVITDSGGLQEETSVLGVPCLTVRENTERAVTLEAGRHELVSPRDVGVTLARLLSNPAHRPDPPPMWDGMSARRIATQIMDWLTARHAQQESDV